MHEQLGRYLADERQGKVPDELGVHQYGSTVWLTATRQRPVARNAPAAIDSTFIRRYQVQSTIGLPILSGDRLLRLGYLNYRNREKAPDDSRLHHLDDVGAGRRPDVRDRHRGGGPSPGGDVFARPARRSAWLPDPPQPRPARDGAARAVHRRDAAGGRAADRRGARVAALDRRAREQQPAAQRARRHDHSDAEAGRDAT